MRHRAAVLSTAGSCLIWCAALPASADLVVFDLAWSGASFGNGATATGRITIDDALLANPGNNSSTTPGLVTALVVTISGASAGNGTYGLADFTDFFLNTGSLALDFTRELVGQPTGQDPWGTFQPGNTGGDFNLRGASPAPSDTDNFQLTTNGGAGDHLLLTSLRPRENEILRDLLDDVELALSGSERYPYDQQPLVQAVETAQSALDRDPENGSLRDALAAAESLRDDGWLYRYTRKPLVAAEAAAQIALDADPGSDAATQASLEAALTAAKLLLYRYDNFRKYHVTGTVAVGERIEAPGGAAFTASSPLAACLCRRRRRCRAGSAVADRVGSPARLKWRPADFG